MIPKTLDVTEFTQSQVPVLATILDSIRRQAVTIKYMSSVPTASTVAAGEIVIYDNDAGTMRVYFLTGAGNLGYVALT